MVKSYKIKLHPNKIQQDIMNKSFGLARFIYNWSLDRQIKNYEEHQTFINKYELKKQAIKLKNKLKENLITD